MSDENNHDGSGLTPKTPVSVVVINYEGSEHLAHTLPAVAALEGDVTEVILVDNASTDDSVARARELLPSVTVIMPVKGTFFCVFLCGCFQEHIDGFCTAKTMGGACG